MVSHPEYWRRDLKKMSDSLKKRYNQKRWDARSINKVEKEIFLGFFMVRKLIENDYVDDRIKSRNIILKEYAKISDTYINDPSKFPRSYDLMNGNDTQLTYKKLANQFIHSYYFSLFVPFNKSLVGFYFASDDDRSDRIFYLRLLEVIQVYNSVHEDSLLNFELIHNPDNTFTVSKK
jgi:hypothetical protein